MLEVEKEQDATSNAKEMDAIAKAKEKDAILNARELNNIIKATELDTITKAMELGALNKVKDLANSNAGTQVEGEKKKAMNMADIVYATELVTNHEANELANVTHAA